MRLHVNLLASRIIVFPLKKTILLEWSFFALDQTEIAITILLDWMRLLFIRVVCLIASKIFLYSDYYIDEEKNKRRFRLILSLFIISMCLLILRPSMVSILLG